MEGFDEEAFKKFFPSGFGKQDKEVDVEGQINSTKRGDSKPKLSNSKSSDEIAIAENDERRSQEKTSYSSVSDSETDSNTDEDEFPTSHELVFRTHDRAVTTITVDPAGARMISGSTDCSIKFHDFASLTPTTLRAFKSIEPSLKKTSAASETHPVHVAEFNQLYPSQVFVVTATAQPRVLDRNGETLTEFVKGDMYLRDMKNTKGHISEVTSGTWSPTDYNLCVTAGTDSTVRIWDANVGRSQKEVIVHKSHVPGAAGRTRMTAVAWGSPAQGGNNILVSAALDGSLSMWSGNGPFSRPSAEIRDAHERDSWTSGLDVSPDGRFVVTKGGDNTIKLWDTRKFQHPLKVVPHTSIAQSYPSSNIRFSHNGMNILTGSEAGELVILTAATLQPELVAPVTPGSPLITVNWHDRLNQILTGSANGETHMLYNPSISAGGAITIMSKAPKRRHIDDNSTLTVDIPHGMSASDLTIDGNGNVVASRSTYASRHPTVGLTASGRSRDPRRPHIPLQTPFAKSQPDEKHIKESIPQSTMRDEDPREALLKYAEKAEKEPMFTKAWMHTQPKPIYADISDDEEQKGGPVRKKARQ